MDCIGMSEKTEIIEGRKKLNAMLRKTQAAAKPDTCILCGKRKTSYCNSHSVPRMVLKNISEDGMVLHANTLIGMEMIDTEKGINNSGTFHFICADCDERYFRDYENPSNLLAKPNDRMLAEIALKNSLIQLSKRYQEVEIYKGAKNNPNVKNINILETVHALDIREYTEEVSLYKAIIENNDQNCFHLLFWKKLPYVTPIAAQSGIALMEDLEGRVVNDIGNLSEALRIQNMHIGVFPLAETTVVIAFYHKRDRRYRKLRNKLNASSDEFILKYINWLIVKYTENYFISRKAQEIIEKDSQIQKLSRESNGAPNLGLVDPITMIKGYKPIGMEDITNLLAPECALRKIE